MSAFFIYDSGPYGIFSPIRPLYQTKILTSLFLATPLSCNMMFLLFRKRCISNICPVIILAWQKIFQGKAFQNDIVPWGVYTYTWQEILSPYCRQNNNRVILSIYEESPKKYTSRLRFFGVTHSQNEIHLLSRTRRKRCEGSFARLVGDSSFRLRYVQNDNRVIPNRDLWSSVRNLLFLSSSQ